MSKLKWMAGSCFALALGLLALGCAGKAGDAVSLSPAKAQHQADWIKVHYAGYSATPDQCRACHGSTTDPAMAGGISKVSCFTCHSKGVDHPAGWAAPTQHGRMGAQFPVSPDPKEMAGFAHCAKCHGDDYTGGSATTSCKSCHNKAPHPDRPWTGLGAASSHTATHYSNAPECYKCHKDGANSVLKPLAAPAAGALPGCFNNTMCHATNVS